MTMKKKIIIRGKKVHNVGYRAFLLGIAESLEIERFFADNMFINKKQAVYALIGSSEENVKAFIEIASSKSPDESDVEKVDVEDYEGNVMKVESYYRYLSAMQLSKIVTYGGRMIEKQDVMIEKQSENTGEIVSEIKSLRGDLKSYFDERLIRLELEVAQIKAKVCA